MEIKKLTNLHGEITVPGDKSISHRAVMFGSLAKGTTRITHFLEGADCLSTISCFRKMGIDIENNNGEVYQEMGVQIFEDYVGKYLADRVIRVIIFTVLFTVFYASLHIVIVWLNLLSRLPIIYGLNKIAGAVLGLTEALIFVWIGCLVLTLFSGSPIGKSMIDQINGSIWLTWLYDHNMLSYLVVGLVRSVL